MAEVAIGFEGAARQAAVIERLGLPTQSPDVDRDEVMTFLHRDKKKDHAGLRMVLLEDFGRPIVRHVDDGMVAEGLAAIGVRS